MREGYHPPPYEKTPSLIPYTPRYILLVLWPFLAGDLYINGIYRPELLAHSFRIPQKVTHNPSNHCNPTIPHPLEPNNSPNSRP